MHCTASVERVAEGIGGELHPHVINCWLLGDYPGKKPFIRSPALQQSGFENSLRAPLNQPLLSSHLLYTYAVAIVIPGTSDSKIT